MDSAHTEEPGAGDVVGRPTLAVRLRDGVVAELRPISPEDRHLLVEGLAQMSMESRFARFGSGIARLSEAELRYLTDIDQRSHVAWGATVDDQPAGIGRFIVDAESDAEVAVAVVDRFQRRGLGRALFDALIASARDGGIRSFTFSIEPWNREVLRMLPGVAVALDEADGMLVGKIQLDQVPIGEREQEMVTLLDEFREGNMAD